MGNYIYMNIFKKKFQKIQKPLDASLFCVYLLKVPTFTRGNIYTLEMQLLCLTKSSQDSFLHTRPISYNVYNGQFNKILAKLDIIRSTGWLKYPQNGQIWLFWRPWDIIVKVVLNQICKYDPILHHILWTSCEGNCPGMILWGTGAASPKCKNFPL